MIVHTYDVQANNLAAGLLDLPHLAQEVPETRLGDDIVWSEDAHAVKLWVWLSVGRQVSTNDLIFLKAT